MLTRAQNALYWREWGAAKALLITHTNSWTKQEENERRHELHTQALGEEKSHVDFNNDDFDKVLAAFRAISRPGDLNAQLHALNGQRKRLLFGIRRLVKSMGADEFYVQGIIDRMDARRGEKPGDDQDDWERERERDERPRRKLEDLHPRELTKVMVALKKHESRGCLHAHTADLHVQTVPSDSVVAKAEPDPF